MIFKYLNFQGKFNLQGLFNTVLYIEVLFKPVRTLIYMGESFQDYSQIQDFEADFPQKVGFKMLN